MLLLGLLAIIQTTFLPGLLILHFAKIKTQSIIQKYIYVLAISLFANYTVVTALVLLKIYFKNIVLLIIVFEVLLFVFLFIKKRITSSDNNNFIKLIYFLSNLIKQNTTTVKILIVSSLIVILFYVSLFISNIGTIFYFVDTVNNIHWNTWSLDFAHNILPVQSSHFPQLIPANWSISYLLIDKTNVHFFPKSFMPLFFLGNLLMFFDLAIQNKKYVYLIALIIYGLFAPIIYNVVFIADGNGDLPVSFFAFLAFYAYLKRDATTFDLKEYVIIFLFAATAAGTKLAGSYVFFFVSIFCLYQLIINYKTLSKKEILILFVSVSVILASNLFWYLFKPQTMVSGLHQPEWLKPDYIGIVKNAFSLLYYNFGLPVLAFFILTVGFSLFVKKIKLITIVFVIPPFILWIFKYSADFRNLSFVVPFLSYVSAFGVIKIIEILKNNNFSDELLISDNIKVEINKKRIYQLVVLIFGGLFFYYLIMSNYFYQILYSTYSFVSKYYFQSHRISYLTDFTFFLPVDYYQNIIATMFITTSILSFLVLFKVKIKYLLMLLVVCVIGLSFSVITNADILNHQQKQFDKVDARVYYFRLNTILKGAKLSGDIYTNLESICSEKIPREQNFYFIDSNEILQSINTDAANPKKYFLKLNTLDEQTKNTIQSEIKNGKFEIFYDDGDYLLIIS